MDRVYRDRLLKLAEFLREKVKPEEFDLSRFIKDVRSDKLRKGKADRRYMFPGCGTAACAIGWATHLWPKQFWFEAVDGGVLELNSADDDFGERFFELDGCVEWPYLFGGQHKRTTKQEALVIELFVAQKIQEALAL